MERGKENHILPFLWMRGEENALIKEELDKIEECGIREVCLESRPHPDYCGPLWWKNLDFILEEARKRQMRVWVLDDDKFPTGHCNGAFEKRCPELSKIYLAERHMDIIGPCRGNAVLVENFLGEDGKLLGILACPKPDEESLAVEREGILDLTENYKDGFVFFDLPEGKYRLFILFTTRKGGGRPDYINLIDPDSVHVLIEEVYEKHYERYQEYFGKEFAGFFSDEPELGNVPGYPFDCALGQRDIRLPWSRQLEAALRTQWGEEFLTNLPALWYEAVEGTEAVRFTYMDEMTKLVSSCFSMQLGNWCREHGVEYIGHILEDANSHTKLGCGTGHYFREMEGQHMAGIDVVHHEIVPGFTGKIHQWIAGDEDGEFFHFGLAKMGSSAAHIDPEKKNRALCEIFGNYGWAEGIGLMRWLTDHMLVRGINYFTPHAFSMVYPDRDCPPHFYARGNNPQFACFAGLMKYMERSAGLLSGGIHQAQAAVLYHGKMEWPKGQAGLFQKPVRALMEHQLDCDVVPCDILEDGRARIEDGQLVIGEETYACLIIPGCHYLTPGTAAFLEKAGREGLKVFVTEEKPELLTDGKPLPGDAAAAQKLVSLEQLADEVEAIKEPYVRVHSHDRGLRIYTVIKEGKPVCMLFNENITGCIRTEISFADESLDAVTFFDTWNDREETYSLNGKSLPVVLEAGSSLLFAAFDAGEEKYGRIPVQSKRQPLSTGWKVSRQPWGSQEGFEDYTEVGVQSGAPGQTKSGSQAGAAGQDGLGNEAKSGVQPGAPGQDGLGGSGRLPGLNGPGYDPGFTGTYRYRGTFQAKVQEGKRYFLLFPEVSDALHLQINGCDAGWQCHFPSRVEVTGLLKNGENEICADITTTLVWERKDGASTHLQIPASGLTAQPVLEEYDTAG